MEQLRFANYHISSAVLADPAVSVNLSVDPVRGSLRGHATVIVGEVRRMTFDLEGSYMPLDGVPAVLSLHNGPLQFPVMYPSRLEILIALPHGWKSGFASFIYSHGPDQTEIRVKNAMATLCSPPSVQEMQ